MDCQFHNNCGGFCETTEEQEINLCRDCLDAYHEREAEHAHYAKMKDALQRIAVAAGIDLSEPDVIANVVCEKLAQLKSVALSVNDEIIAEVQRKALRTQHIADLAKMVKPTRTN
ncbi:MAG: hypothetical protein NT086_19670 [Proteobacteria bacterium]|nr:hypothetical protein [Pseudomonadota bacterium]